MTASIQWGAVSDWISGISTLVAVVVALLFSLRAEHAERNARLAAVFAWYEAGLPSGHLCTTNSTEAPIYDWRATVTWTDPQTGATRTLSTGSADFGLLPPGKLEFQLRIGPEAIPGNDAAVAVRLDFADAMGRRFTRSATGALTRSTVT